MPTPPPTSSAKGTFHRRADPGRNDPLAEVCNAAAQAARAGVRPRYLLLDRGFCSVDMLRYLQAPATLG